MYYSPVSEWSPEDQREFSKVAAMVYAANPGKLIQCIKDLRQIWGERVGVPAAGLKECKDAIERAQRGYSEAALLALDEDELTVLYEAVRIYLNTYGSAAMEGSDEMLSKLRDLRERQGWS